MNGIKALDHKLIAQELRDEYFPKLIDAIIKGDVILVVGSNFELNIEGNKSLSSLLGTDANFSDYALRVLNETYKTDACSFSDLENLTYKDDETGEIKLVNICASINVVLKDAGLTIDDVSQSLRNLISTGFFRFVITTSYTPLVEIAMKEQWGEFNVDVLNIYDSEFEKRDIEFNYQERCNPTIYYLQGKAGTAQKFVVTDKDYLNFMKTMMLDMKNYKLLEMTSSKHLLVLGCDQDDWLFRFIWYALKVDMSSPNNGSIGRKKPDVKLDKFLAMNNVTLKYNSKQFADDIYTALMNAKETRLFNDPSKQKWDVFISYSRNDGKIAQEVYNALTNAGLKVWYDKINLGGRGVDFMEYIYEAIRSSTVFMPILSETITKQREEIHPYRLEWKYAIENGRINQTGTVSCIPVIQKDYNIGEKRFSDKIPKEFVETDAHIYNPLSLDFDEWAMSVKDIISNKQ